MDAMQFPHWAVMWMLAASLYAACKWVTWRRASVGGAPLWKSAGYLLAWPGLDAASFLDGRSMQTGARPEGRAYNGDVAGWLAGLSKLAYGIVLFYGVARLIPPGHEYLVAWVGGIGLVLILHFGLFQLLSCAWRRAGVPARPLMNRPLASASIADFWGRRWNTSFKDFTHRYIYRPVAASWGPRWGVAAGFAFSAVLHDLVISVPAGGGYGRPTVYFSIQGAAVMLERSGLGRRLGLVSGWRPRLFAVVVLVGPLGLLFHRPFMVGIIVPFMRALGAL